MRMIFWYPMDIKCQVKLQMRTKRLKGSYQTKLSSLLLKNNQIMIGGILSNSRKIKF